MQITLELPDSLTSKLQIYVEDSNRFSREHGWHETMNIENALLILASRELEKRLKEGRFT